MRPIMQHVAALTEGAQVLQPVVGRIAVQMRRRKHDAGHTQSSCLHKVGPSGHSPSAIPPGLSHRGSDCSGDHACATPRRSGHRWQTPAAVDTPGVAPAPSTCLPPQSSAIGQTAQSSHAVGSVPDRSSGSPSSHVTPNAATTGCPSDISIGDAGDISIGDLQERDAILALC
jgi:hypothetical protein